MQTGSSNNSKPGPRVQEIPPIVHVNLEHFPGKVYHPGPGPIVVMVDDKNRVFFSGSCIYVPPAEWLLKMKCSGCGVGFGYAHDSLCPHTQCTVTGLIRADCDGDHKHDCGQDYYRG